MNANRVYAVTVNWNRPADTLACLESLRRQRDSEIILVVVDNHSQDDSIVQLQTHAPDAILLQSERNLGFSGGYNLGMRYCLAQGAERILIVNNDTHADPFMVSELLQACGERIAAVGPVIYYDEDPQKIWSQGSRMNWVLMDQRDQHGRRLPLPETAAERDFLSGCCLLLERKALEDVGLLDEDFFLYYEDLDWCVRFHQKHWTLALAPRAMLWHKISASSQGSDSRSERYWMAFSSVHYFRKHIRGLAWLLVIPWRVGSAVKTSLRLSGVRRWTALAAYWKGLRDALR